MPLESYLEVLREVADLPMVFLPHLIETVHGLQLLMVGQQPCPRDYLGGAGAAGWASAWGRVKESCGSLLGVIWFMFTGAWEGELDC